VPAGISVANGADTPGSGIGPMSATVAAAPDGSQIDRAESRVSLPQADTERCPADQLSGTLWLWKGWGVSSWWPCWTAPPWGTGPGAGGVAGARLDTDHRTKRE
jgi:hypothetical protein